MGVLVSSLQRGSGSSSSLTEQEGAVGTGKPLLILIGLTVDMVVGCLSSLSLGFERAFVSSFDPSRDLPFPLYNSLAVTDFSQPVYSVSFSSPIRQPVQVSPPCSALLAPDLNSCTKSTESFKAASPTNFQVPAGQGKAALFAIYPHHVAQCLTYNKCSGVSGEFIHRTDFLFLSHIYNVPGLCHGKVQLWKLKLLQLVCPCIEGVCSSAAPQIQLDLPR